jgi:hypothetical protein
MVISGSKGQAAVEMAVVMPVLLAVLGISVNLMVFLGDCARFDRVAAEAIRTEAASPGYNEYGSVGRADKVRSRIEASFSDSEHLSFSVAASESGLGVNDADGGNSDIGFSLLPHHETFVCVMNYRPWGFEDSFFGIKFTGIPHTRSYVIDPYRPGVIL